MLRAASRAALCCCQSSRVRHRKSPRSQNSLQLQMLRRKARQKLRHMGGGRRNVLPHAHLLVAPLAGHHGLALVHLPVLRGQTAKQLAVHVLHRLRAVQRGHGRFAAVALLQGRLGLNVRHRQTLLGRQFLVGREVLAQGLLNLMRARVLAFNAVGVVGIHAAQQHMQLWWHTLARQGRGRTHQVTGLGQQGLLPGVRGQQGFKLVG